MSTIFFLKLIIWNIDIHTCLLDSTFLCPHLFNYKEDYSLTYVKLDEVIKIVKSLGVNASLSKCGVSNALKNIPLNPERWHLFGFKWEDKYYFYTRLCFGYRSSPNIISYMWPFVGFCRIIIIWNMFYIYLMTF